MALKDDVLRSMSFFTMASVCSLFNAASSLLVVLDTLDEDDIFIVYRMTQQYIKMQQLRRQQARYGFFRLSLSF